MRYHEKSARFWASQAIIFAIAAALAFGITARLGGALGAICSLVLFMGLLIKARRAYRAIQTEHAQEKPAKD